VKPNSVSRRSRAPPHAFGEATDAFKLRSVLKVRLAGNESEDSRRPMFRLVLRSRAHGTQRETFDYTGPEVGIAIDGLTIA
jgi:hypothetical protein